MELSGKPTGYGKHVFEEDFRPVQSPKPEAPSNFNFAPGTSRVSGARDSGDNENVDYRGFAIVERPKRETTATDFGVKDVFNVVKSLDANRYATKKTIAQGMLDIALLTANASQLKYILQVGKQHEFYTLMLTLICVSIGLQLLQGIIFIMLGSWLNINKTQDHQRANLWNNISLVMMLLTVAVNIVLSVFEMRDVDVNSDNSVKFNDGSSTSSPGIR